MKLCKDCIHREICREAGLNRSFPFEECPQFKDKFQVTELPCKVGDRLYRPVVDYIREETVVSIIQRIFKNANIVTLHTEHSVYDVEEIGNLIFFTKPEAEQKLNELTENE